MLYADNKTITASQQSKMLLLDLFAACSMVLPGIAARQMGKAGLWAIVAGGIMAVIYGGLIISLGKNTEKNFYNSLKSYVTKPLAIIIMAGFFLKFMFGAVYILKMFTQVINNTFLTELPEKLMGALVILTAFYCVTKGIETRARLGSIIVWIVVVPVVFICVLALLQMDINQVFPIETAPLTHMINSGAMVAVLFQPLEFLLFSLPYVKEKKHAYRKVVKSIGATIGISALIYVACIGVFSAQGAAKETWPAVILMQVIKIPGYFGARQDGVMVAFWMAAPILLIAGYVFYGDLIVRQVCVHKYLKWLLGLWLGIVYIVFCVIDQSQTFFDMFLKVSLWVGLIPTACLLVILLICQKVKGKEQHKNEN